MAVVNASSIRARPWGDACASHDLVDRADLIVVQEKMPPRTSEIRHSHTKARQFFYVLAGTLTIERAGEVYTLEARDGLEIAPGTIHVVSNTTSAVVEFLAIASPTTKGDRVTAAAE